MWDFPLLSRLGARLSRGKVSRPCLTRPVRRALPRSLRGGQEDAPDTATVLEMSRRCAALSQRLAAGRGPSRALIAVAHAIMRRACAMGSRQAPSPACGAHACDARPRHTTVDGLAWRLAPRGSRVPLARVTSVVGALCQAFLAPPYTGVGPQPSCTPLRKHAKLSSVQRRRLLDRRT